MELIKQKSPERLASDGAYEGSQSGCLRSSPTQEDDLPGPSDNSSSVLKTLASHDLKIFNRNAAQATSSEKGDPFYQSVLSRLDSS